MRIVIGEYCFAQAQWQKVVVPRAELGWALAVFCKNILISGAAEQQWRSLKCATGAAYVVSAAPAV